MGEYLIEVLGVKIEGQFSLFAGDRGYFYVSVPSDFEKRVLYTNRPLKINHCLFIEDSYSGGTELEIPCEYYIKSLESFIKKFNSARERKDEDVKGSVIKHLEIRDGRLHYTL
jgi:hypothetical protein